MTNADPSPFTGKDGETAASYSALIAAKDGSSVQQDLTTTSTGTRQPLDVAIMDASGNQVTSFGGGTQYTEGDTDASITGTAMMMEGAGNTLLAVPGTTADGLLVNLGANNDVSLNAGDNTVGRVKLTDGTDVADVLDLTNSNPLTVAIVDTNGDQISSFGGGTQYTEDAAAAANPVGTALMLVREDGRAGGLTTTDGDNVAARGNNKGEMYVKATDSDALLATIDADTSNISTKIDTLAGAVSGTEFQVDVLTMPTTTVQATNLDIRDLSSASDSVTAVQATAANLNMTEANSGSIKTSVELIDDGIATVASAITTKGMAAVGTDGTNARILKTDTSGELQVDVLTMPTVTVTATNLDVQSGGADLATSTQAGAIQTAVELIDDTVKVLGTDTYTEATSKGVVMGAVRRDADTTLVNTTNEFGPLQMDANGRLKVEAFSGETLPVSLTSTTITGTVAVTQSGTWDEVGINDSGNSITVDNGGTFVTQENGALLTAAQLIDDTIIADNNGFTDGTTKVNMAGYIYDEVAGTALTENDAAAARINVNRAQVHAIEDGTTRGRYATVTASNALKVDNSGVTQPVSAASLPLPTGASTLAEQQTQTTALQLIDDIVYTDDTSTHSTGTSKGALFMAAATPTDTAVNANDIGALGMTNNRELYVSLRDISGAAAVTGSGTATGALRVELPTNGTGVIATVSNVATIGTSVTPGTSAAHLGKAEDAAHASGDTGVALLERRIDTAATSADTSGDYATANQSAEGASWATLTPTTTSGLSVANFTSGDTYTALTNSAQAIKASAGNLYGYYIYNPNATVAYVMVYNIAAASVTVGTSTASLVFAIPPTAAANLMFPYPITFSNAGWSCAAATTGGGNTAPSSALEAMFWYK